MNTAKITYQGELRTECTHLKSDTKIITDAPTDNHGKGEAFSPTDLLATSLAACMITIIGIRADENNFEIGECTAEMKKIMASEPRRVSEIHIKLKFSNHNLTEDQKRFLEDAAINCPVAKSLSTEIIQNIDFEY